MSLNTLPRVVLIGRTNVGKSTLFNRLADKAKALVSDIAGTTRDTRSAECFWAGQTILITDTAGLDVEGEEITDIEAVRMAKKAMTEADLVLLVVDARHGLMPQDREYAEMVRRAHLPVILVANKIDNHRQLNLLNDFAELGIDAMTAVSAKSGSGTGDLLDMVREKLPAMKEVPEETEEETATRESAEPRKIKIALIGKPNVGKSSLLNSLAGETRAIVSPIPHTTRDPQDFSFDYELENKKYSLTFVDTAGIIKQRKRNERLQELSIDQSIAMIGKCDIIFLVIDAGQDITQQDKNLSREILEQGKSLIFVVNKWDLVPDKTTESDQKYRDYLYGHFPYLTWAPVVFISAKNGSKMPRLIETAITIHNQQQQKVSPTALKHFTAHLVKKQPPRQSKGLKPPYIHEIKQVKTSPLVFEIVADTAENIHFSYRRFIINELRAWFHYDGCGIRLSLTERQIKKHHQT